MYVVFVCIPEFRKVTFHGYTFQCHIAMAEWILGTEVEKYIQPVIRKTYTVIIRIL